MLLHMLLIILTTLQVSLIINALGSYSRRFEKSFYYLFLDNTADYTDKDYVRERAFFSVPELRDFVK